MFQKYLINVKITFKYTFNMFDFVCNVFVG